MLRLQPLLRQLTIQPKRGTLARFEPNWAQQELLASIEAQVNAGKPVRNIVLKARQLGISTATEAVLFWWSFLFPGSNYLVLAHEVGTSKHLFEMTRLFWETFPFRDLYTMRSYTQQRLNWEETRSSIKIATAGNQRSGVGLTLRGIHCSEVALWENPEELMLGLLQAVPDDPGTFVLLESTARGVGNYFYNEWQAAVNGDSDYVPLFFPWWKEPEYTASFLGHGHSELGRLDPDEKFLRKLGVDDDHLSWRRYQIRNKTGGDSEKFKQEYPAVAEEAFLQSGTSVFPLDKLQDCYVPEKGAKGDLVRDGNKITFHQSRNGPLTLFRWPSKDHNYLYFAGADPSHATNDLSCIQVINRNNMEQVAVWHGMLNGHALGDELVKIGKYFNDAMVTTEIEGGGHATISRMLSLGYPHIWRHQWADKAQGKLSTTYGWSTNYNRKHWAVNKMQHLLYTDSIIIHDAVTFEQMKNYVSYASEEMGPANWKDHDDAVMALCITCCCHMLEPMFYGEQGPPMLPEFRTIEEGQTAPPWDDPMGMT